MLENQYNNIKNVSFFECAPSFGGTGGPQRVPIRLARPLSQARSNTLFRAAIQTEHKPRSPIP